MHLVRQFNEVSEESIASIFGIGKLADQALSLHSFAPQKIIVFIIISVITWSQALEVLFETKFYIYKWSLNITSLERNAVSMSVFMSEF